MNSVPVIRIEIERMQQTLSTMLSEHAAQIDTELQASLEQFCQPENIKRIISATASSTLEGILKGELDNFFRYGAGRRTLSDAVQRQLGEMGLAEGVLTEQDHERIRQWFSVVQDLNPAYLVAEDYVLAKRLYEKLGLRVPNSITEKLP